MTALDRRRLLLLAPLGVVGAAGAAFTLMLTRMSAGRFDPHAVDAPIVGKPVPDFTLPGLGDAPGFSAADLRAAAATRPVLLNFFASWCLPCAAEADIVAELARTLPVWGVAYEDKPADAARFLGRYGNPYARLAADARGRTAIDFGVSGVPESFLIGRDGHVLWHLAGPFDDAAAGRLTQTLHAA